MGALQPVGLWPGGLCCRFIRNGGLHVWHADPARQAACLYAFGPGGRPRRAVSHFFTYTGDAAFASGNAYTLFSIAAVVLGGVSLFGGKGSAIGAVFGALAFRTIGDLLFVFDLDPLWQPLFQGLILLAAISLGALALFRVRNRLEWFL